MVPDQRAYGSFMKEDSPAYRANENQAMLEAPLNPEALAPLLQDVPMP
jgi:hypothetical protein